MVSQRVLPTFKAVSLIFAVSAVGTGLQALVDPTAFSRGFGIPIGSAKASLSSGKKGKSDKQNEESPCLAYVSLMGVRQMATGITLLTFAYQGKWSEMGTILAILGILVAGTDGVMLARSNSLSAGAFHAIPGALIALLAGAVALSP